MKASEIMINDLIYVYGQNGNIAADPHWYVRKVTADWLVDMVRSEEKDRRIAESGITIPDGQLYIGDAKPIPLTPEILKANGWKWRKKGLISSMRLFDEDGHSIMTLTYGNIMSIGGHEIKVQYVHELQRALRCCGLNDIADNFKIE